jgi:hypothetical protein
VRKIWPVTGREPAVAEGLIWKLARAWLGAFPVKLPPAFTTRPLPAVHWAIWSAKVPRALAPPVPYRLPSA